MIILISSGGITVKLADEFLLAAIMMNAVMVVLAMSYFTYPQTTLRI